MTRQTLLMLPALLALVMADVGGALADTASGWSRGDNHSVRLIAASDGIGPDGTVQIGVQMRLPSGWKTYWRSPGQAGVPTRFDWRQSTNLESATVVWPKPERFSDFELETYGYEGQVVIPITVKVADPDQPVSLDVKVDFGVCKEICIPAEAHLTLELQPAATPEATRYAKLIDRFRNQVPGQNGEQGLTLSSLVLEQNGSLQRLEVLATSETEFQWPDVALELPPAYRTGVPGVRMSMDRRQVRLSLPLWSNHGAAPLAGETVGVTLWDEDGRAVEHSFVVEPPVDTASTQ